MGLKDLGVGVGFLIAGVGLVAAPSVITNYLNNDNISYEEANGTRVKIDRDGLFGYTEFKTNGSNIDVWKWDGFFSNNYKDKDGDGVVESLSKYFPNQFSKGTHLQTLYRYRDFEKYKAHFLKADRDLRKDMQRFIPGSHM